MALRFRFTTSGDPLAMMLDEIVAAEKAATEGTKKAGRGLLRDWRKQVRGALGYRMAGALRARSYPEHTVSINAASLVYAPSNKARRAVSPTYIREAGATAAEVIDAHDKGATIRSADGFFLAIPLGSAARMKGATSTGRGDRTRITPGGWERKTGRKLRFVYRKGENSLLVDDGSVAPGNVMLWRNGRRGVYRNPRAVRKRQKQPVPVFVLVPQVRLRAKTDLDRDVERWGDLLPELILSNWRSPRGGR